MPAPLDVLSMRHAAGRRPGSNRRTVQWLLRGSLLVECVLLVVVLMLTDFDDPTHKLLLACAFLAYWAHGMCLLALGAFLQLQTERVLAALETGAPDAVPRR